MYLSARLPVAVALVGVAAVVVPVDQRLALFGGLVLLAALAALDVVRAPRATDLAFERLAPDVVAIGRTATVTVRLHNPAGRRLRIAVRDAAPPSIRRTPQRHAAVADPGEHVAFVAALAPTRRGVLTLGPATIRTAGLLGLAGRQQTLADTRAIRVYPELPSRSEVELRLDRARMLMTGERTSAIRGGGTDFDTLRDYHRDDEFRRINWKATARAARPITNVYREDRNQQVILLLDASRMMAATVAGVPRFEHALDAGFAVAELAAHAGDHVGMVAFHRDVVAMVGPRGGPAQPNAIMSRLFDLEPTLDAPNYGRAFATLLARHRRRSLMVLLTELTDPATLQPLISAVPALVVRHLVLVGAVRDPQTEGLASSVPTTSADAYLKASASGTLLERGHAAARLSSVGVGVVDAQPGRLAAMLADRYLRIKAQGRL